jgi:L-2-hydroxyglutarate oxidase
MGSQPPPSSCDVVVVGGGIVGLAVARELAGRNPRSKVCVLERETDLATHQTGHNSGVIHSGLYYTPGSLKASLCVAGARDLYEYCERRGVRHERCGKLVLATDASEAAALGELQRRGAANGVRGLRLLDAGEISSVEPHAWGVAALHSPDTGIVDYGEVSRALAQDLLESGATIHTGCEVTATMHEARSLRLVHSLGATSAGSAVFCAGAWSDRLTVDAGAGRDPQIVPFRGRYLALRPERREMVRALVYPVPDPALPFLGVHLTRDIHGRVLVGPSAMPALRRDPREGLREAARDALDTVRWPGTWRMAAAQRRAAASELRMALSRDAMLAGAAKLVPGLVPDDVEPSFSGIRAQGVARDGRLFDDFAFSMTPRALHVRNAPSPAATASLAIARHVADRASEMLDLGR